MTERKKILYKLFCGINLPLFLVLIVSQFVYTQNNIPFFAVDTTIEEYTRFVNYVDQAIAGNPQYGYSAIDPVILYTVTKDKKHAEEAVSLIENHVLEAESTITAGERPKVSADSYLHVGPIIAGLAFTFDWANEFITEQQKTRWKAYADQAIFNVWNPREAQWGTESHPWSGWSINNPANNYHYSFLWATMTWALASKNQEWIDFLKTEKFPPLVENFKEIPGGGSLEGTGYGVSHKRLFDIYMLWKSAMNEDLSAESIHAAASIDYWIHATVPTLERFAPIGDQARVSSAPLYDYHRALVIKAVMLNKDAEIAARGMWWLNNISVSTMSSSFNLRHNIFTLPETSKKPTKLSYYSPGVGDLFARTSWNKGATWIHFKTGVYNESHAHQDQGAFSIYNGEWQAVTENIHTHSGIQQRTNVHNLIQFVKNDSITVRQKMAGEALASMEYTDSGDIVSIRSDLSQLYRDEPNVQAWVRFLDFDRRNHTVAVRDSFACNTDSINALWQLNTPKEPKVRGDSVFADKSVIISLDKNVKTSVLEWHTMKPDDENWQKEFKEGWKIELTKTDNIQEFNVLIKINTANNIIGKNLFRKNYEGLVSVNSAYNSLSAIEIRFTLPAGRHTVDASIYTVRGQRVWYMPQKTFTGGIRSVTCDLKDVKGMSHGYYLLESYINGRKVVCPFMVIR